MNPFDAFFDQWLLDNYRHTVDKNSATDDDDDDRNGLQTIVLPKA